MYHSVVIRVDDRFINTYDDWHLIPSSRPVIAPPIAVPTARGRLPRLASPAVKW